MRTLLTRHHHSIKEFLKFSLVGVLNTGVDFAIFFLLTWLDTPYVPAQIISYSCGTANSYVCNKFWTFRRCGLSPLEIARFVAINIGSLVLSVLILRLLHENMGMTLVVAKAGATVLALVVNFLGNKLWVFR